MMDRYLGRNIIWTDVPEVTIDNVADILIKAYPAHRDNSIQIDKLIRFEKGEQPLQRKTPKSYRPDIDFQSIDNVAAEITEFSTSYRWGNPITFVQRGEVDANQENGDESVDVALLNECYSAEDIDSKNQELGRYVEITGLGYTYVDINTEWMDGDSYFTVDVLDPRFTFVIRSTYYLDHRKVAGVTYWTNEKKEIHFTVFTPRSRFELDTNYKVMNGNPVKGNLKHSERSGELNPLGRIPIVEWIRNHDRMGCFERQIDEMNSLNLLISDTLNQVDQQTQAIWHTNDVDFPEVENTAEDGTTSYDVVKPKSNDWIETFTTPDGKTPFIKPLSIEYDYSGILETVLAKRSLILQKCGVPERNNANGGSTGVAMSDATGWSAAEASANKQQLITEACKMEEVRLVLKAIQLSPHVPFDSPLLQLKYRDIRPNVKRNRSFDLITKSNALATLLSHGINGLQALKVVNLFDDNTQAWADSREMVEAYQTNLFTNELDVNDIPDRTASDLSDQADESPVIDGYDRINHTTKTTDRH